MADQPSAKPTVHIVQTGESYVCSESQSLLQGMIKLGRKCIPVGCVNGGCGVCKVRVVKGKVNKQMLRQDGTEALNAVDFVGKVRSLEMITVQGKVQSMFAGSKK